MKFYWFAAFALAVTLLPLSPAHASSRDKASWKWPLYEPAQDADGNITTGRPRRLLIESFGGRSDDLHSGIDIGGNHDNDVNGVHLPDVTVIPVASRLAYVFDHDDCGSRRVEVRNRGDGGWYCRLWFATQDDELLYYFGHVHYDSHATDGDIEVNSHLREAIEATIGNQTTGAKPCPPSARCAFDAGDLGPTVSDYSDVISAASLSGQARTFW